MCLEAVLLVPTNSAGCRVQGQQKLYRSLRGSGHDAGGAFVEAMAWSRSWGLISATAGASKRPRFTTGCRH